MPFLSILNQTIHYKMCGPPAGSGPVLLLIHGAGGSHLDWPSTVRYIDGVTIVTPDLPGHGQSPPPGLKTIENYAETVIAFVEGLQLEQVVIAGHSMGGAIAQLIALNHPDFLTGAILISTGARMKVSPLILEQIHTDMPAVADFFTKYAWSKKANPIMKGVGRKRVLENNPDTLFGDYSACNQFDVRHRLGEIRVPTLVIGGELDMFMPLKFSRQLAEGIPEARLVTIPGSGHMIQLERPQMVRNYLKDFVFAHLPSLDR
ncbi:MAG: alpha/beta hydrolase [Ardenticatenaceae bacterium]|nr:alpha/beta hydrolase [Ardenticatenaceae bacterium]